MSFTACAFVSGDGETVLARTHSGDGLVAWWRGLAAEGFRIVGMVVYFADGSRHYMEATEFYAVGPGQERSRFWNGNRREDVPPDFTVIPGVEVPDDVYTVVSEAMRQHG